MPQPAAPSVVPLPMYSFLAVEGARAFDLLQGQLTCDMRDAQADRVLPGAWCSPKGRVIANFLVWAAEPDRVILRLRADLASDTATALGRYAALSRVQIAPAELACIGVLGHGACARLASACGTAPAERYAVQPWAAGALSLRRSEADPLFEAWVPRDQHTELLARLAAGGPTGSEDEWRGALIAQRLAEVQARTRELFLPQMLGYDSDGTVSFRKGCYTGQEIVARAHYKGSVKRHLTLLRGGPGPCPEPGCALLRAERTTGTVVEAVTGSDGGLVVLAVLGLENGSTESPTLQTPQGVELHPEPADPVL